MMWRNEKGFTLIELMVTIGIVAALAAIAFAVLSWGLSSGTFSYPQVLALDRLVDAPAEAAADFGKRPGGHLLGEIHADLARPHHGHGLCRV